jgi:hypothetical protein
MGLLDRLRKKSPSADVDVPSLLLAAMSLIILTEDKDEDEQDGDMRALMTLAAQVPELRPVPMEDFTKRMQKGMRSSVDLGTLPEAVRKRVFVMAVEVALFSGDISDDEDEALGKLASALKIDDGTAQKVIDVMAMKYVG